MKRDYTTTTNETEVIDRLKKLRTKSPSPPNNNNCILCFKLENSESKFYHCFSADATIRQVCCYLDKTFGCRLIYGGEYMLRLNGVPQLVLRNCDERTLDELGLVPRSVLFVYPKE